MTFRLWTACRSILSNGLLSIVADGHNSTEIYFYGEDELHRKLGDDLSKD